MTEHDLRRRLLTDPVPEELEAAARAWPLVRAAFEGRERVGWVERRSRLVLALAAAAVIVGAAVSPPGQAVGSWIRDRVAGEEEAARPPFRLPAAGRLLVDSGHGPWVVQANGSRRLLGAYEAATWSPRGLFVSVTRGKTLTAVEPETGEVRWSLDSPETVGQPRWSPTPGFRIAYRSGESLRVVVANGTRDRLLVKRAGPAAPAWRPGSRHVLAFVDAAGRIRVVDTDTRANLWRTSPAGEVRQLFWSADGARLAAVVDRGRIELYRRDGAFVRSLGTDGGLVRAAAFAPFGRAIAIIEGGRLRVVQPRTGVSETLLQMPGALEQLEWSPDGRWIVTARPEADQWLFVQTAAPNRVVTISSVTREFDPGRTGEGEFPRIAGWSVTR